MQSKMNQQQFAKWMREEAQGAKDLFDQQHQVTFNTPPQPQIPHMFLNFAKDAEKFLCRSSITIPSNWTKPSRGHYHYCCPHAQEDIIDPNALFNVVISNKHEFFIPFDKELSELIGQTKDIDSYQIIDRDTEDNVSLTIKQLTRHKIIQPIPNALRSAHRLGLEGSFKRYDEIMLHLATKIGESKLTEDNLKTFDRYEKLRNLCLGSSGNERAIAGVKAYEVGRRLVDQLMTTLKPPTIPEGWMPWNYIRPGISCNFCGSILPGKMYYYVESHPTLTNAVACIHCINEGRTGQQQNQQPNHVVAMQPTQFTNWYAAPPRSWNKPCKDCLTMDAIGNPVLFNPRLKVYFCTSCLTKLINKGASITI